MMLLLLLQHLKINGFPYNNKLLELCFSSIYTYVEKSVSPFSQHFLAKPNRAFSFIGVSVPQIQNFRNFGPKLKLLKAKDEFKQLNIAHWSNLAALRPSRAELEQPQFWSHFSQILNLGPEIQIKLLALLGFF